MPKRAFITGIAGQDGSYLTELLIAKNYEVHGLVRRTSVMLRERLDHLNITSQQRKDQLFLHYGDLSESGGLARLLHKIAPDEVYHLGGQSSPRISFELPEHTFDINASGTLRLLECIRDYGKPTRFYHASTSEVFGAPKVTPQTEETPFHPINPYACSKAASHFLTTSYRECFGLFACNGILFNHESPRRSENFVTRKIVHGAVAIKLGHQKGLKLGNLDAKKDWGYAPEYVDAMWRILQHSKPEDFVIATGETHSVREFVELAFSTLGMNWQEHVECDPSQLRPSEAPVVVGDPEKAKRLLQWEPQIRFHRLVALMVEAELNNQSVRPKTEG